MSTKEGGGPVKLTATQARAWPPPKGAAGPGGLEQKHAPPRQQGRRQLGTGHWGSFQQREKGILTKVPTKGQAGGHSRAQSLRTSEGSRGGSGQYGVDLYEAQWVPAANNNSSPGLSLPSFSSPHPPKPTMKATGNQDRAHE